MKNKLSYVAAAAALAIALIITFVPREPALATEDFNPNDAEYINLNEWYSGTAPGDNRGDLYLFDTTARKDSKYKIIMKNEMDDDDGSLFYWKNYPDYGYWATGDDFLKVDPGCTASMTLSLKKNTTYGISAMYGWYSGSYSFVVKEVIAKPAKGKIFSLKAGKRKATVKYRKLGKTSRYQIAYRDRYSDYEYTYSTKTKKTIKNLESGGYYYVKVRGQRKVDGKYYSGKWSAVKKIRVK